MHKKKYKKKNGTIVVCNWCLRLSFECLFKPIQWTMAWQYYVYNHCLQKIYLGIMNMRPWTWHYALSGHIGNNKNKRIQTDTDA